MYYTEAMVVGAYKRASNPRSQIGILAEINGCDKQTIRNILIKNGIQIKEARKVAEKRRGRPPKKEEEATEPAAGEAVEANEEPKDAAVEEEQEEQPAQQDKKIKAPQSVRDVLTKELIELSNQSDEITRRIIEIRAFIDRLE